MTNANTKAEEARELARKLARIAAIIDPVGWRTAGLTDASWQAFKEQILAEAAKACAQGVDSE